jgi:hypothetical protein
MTGMKFMLIIVLLIALAAAAFFTRPSQAAFQDYYVAQATAGDSGLLKTTLDKTVATQYAKNAFTFNDHLLYVTVTKDGATVFTGAFGHWFVKDANAAKPGLPAIPGVK